MRFDRKWFKAVKPKKEHHKQVFYVRLKGKVALTLMKILKPLMGIRRQQIDFVINSHSPIYYRIGHKELNKIQKLLSKNISHKDIASKIGVHRTTISHIARGSIPKWLKLRFASINSDASAS